MSINLDNPQTLMEKVDAVSNLIQQMKIAHTIGDEVTFNNAHKKSAELLLDVIIIIEEKGIE